MPYQGFNAWSWLKVLLVAISFASCKLHLTYLPSTGLIFQPTNLEPKRDIYMPPRESSTFRRCVDSRFTPTSFWHQIGSNT